MLDSRVVLEVYEEANGRPRICAAQGAKNRVGAPRRPPQIVGRWAYKHQPYR
jgi:hypothetical protein